MGKLRHKGDRKAFGGPKGLTFAEQAKSITAMLNNIQAAIRRHVRDAKEPVATREKCINQVRRMFARL